MTRAALLLVRCALCALLVPAIAPGQDADGDGWSVSAGDCDDGDPAISPGASEVCDGADTDCDGQPLSTTLVPPVTNYSISASPLFRGEKHFVSRSTTLSTVESYGDWDVGDELTFGVFEATSINGAYQQVASALVTTALSGLGWEQSPDLGVPLVQGRWYVLGVLITEIGVPTSRGLTISAPQPTNLGSRLGGVHFWGEQLPTSYSFNHEERVQALRFTWSEEDDGDADGQVACSECDDGEPTAGVGMPELCDGIDNDCDGLLPPLEEDDDLDGFNECGDGDCLDSDPATWPGAPELCDAVDNDCDGDVSGPWPDLDGDDLPDCIDTDTDGDGDPDTADCFPLDPTRGPSALELCDAIDQDCDQDLVDQFADVDDDGLPDCLGADLDGDGVLYPLDNCGLANPSQTDLDGDGRGVPCDPDDDGDGVLDALDVCPLTPDPAQLDTDSDGDGDLCDLDDDGDGVPDASDLCPLLAVPAGGDGDGDGLGDACDPDDDGDGHLDGADACPATFDPYQLDFDLDGIGDLCDPDADGDGDPGTTDCDDFDPTRATGGPELCNGLDDDCDGAVPAIETDGDGDGYLSVACGGGDCDDSDPARSPGAVELCDGVDNDCDGAIVELDVSAAPTAWASYTAGFGGVVLSASRASTLHGVSLPLEVVAGDTLTWAVYSAPSPSGPWTSVASATQVPSADIAGITSSPQLDAPLLAGRYYAVGVHSTGEIGYGIAPANADTPIGPGMLLGGASLAANSLPVAPVFDASSPAAMDLWLDDESDGDGDGVLACAECDDLDPTRYPAAPEVCDGLDNDCDGTVPGPELVDIDGDGSLACVDCDDASAAVRPFAAEVCDGLDTDCDGVIPGPETTDADIDGAAACLDCDDADPTRYPGAAELCDGLDGDCDGAIDTAFGPGVTTPPYSAFYDELGVKVLPAQRVTISGFDAYLGPDPSGSSDVVWTVYRATAELGPYEVVERVTSAVTGDPAWTRSPPLVLTLDPAFHYVFTTWSGAMNTKMAGSPTAVPLALPFGTLLGGVQMGVVAPPTAPSYTTRTWAFPLRVRTDAEVDLDLDGALGCDDCDDLEPAIAVGAAEVCDGLDNDCDGALGAAEGTDADADGSPSCDDCDDADPLVGGGAAELCDGIDNDCDGIVPPGELTDQDGDGATDCEDCADADAVSFPGAVEVCDGLDNDCDGALLQEGGFDTWTQDTSRWQGGADAITFEVTSANRLAYWSRLNQLGAQQITWMIYEGTSASGTYTRVWSGTTTTDSASGWFTSPRVDYELVPGTFVGLATWFDGPDTLYRDLPAAVPSMPFGTVVGSPNLIPSLLTPSLSAGVGFTPPFKTYTMDEVDGDGDGALACGDCNDGVAAIAPGATELCDGLDGDCDGVVPATEADDDGDGIFACLDCDDVDATIGPGMPELCDGLDGDCDGIVPPDETADLDADGYVACEDCIDTDSTTFPGAAELCDGIDNDCDGITATLEWGSTNDTAGGTGYMVFRMNVFEPTVATDLVGLRHWFRVTTNAANLPVIDVDWVVYQRPDPSSPWVLMVNEVASHPNAGIGWYDSPPFSITLLPGTQYAIGFRQESGFGTTEGPAPGGYSFGNFVGNIIAGSTFTPPTGTWTVDTTADPLVQALWLDGELDSDGDGQLACEDCADNAPSMNSGALEVCNGQDDDCDGVLPLAESDGDGDGLLACEGDCGDLPGQAGIPAGAEVCDGYDTDCDGLLMPGEALDYDGDGVLSCLDCDDTNAMVWPGAPELCDGIDSDCDGTGEADADGDGFSACADCDDGDGAVSPAAVELCDGADTDCDGALWFRELDADGDGVSPCDGDCDDADAVRSPLLTESCDGIDNSCAGFVGSDEVDADLDGQMPCAGDCDDSDDTALLGAEELCDGTDNDCDGIGDGTDPDVALQPTETWDFETAGTLWYSSEPAGSLSVFERGVPSSGPGGAWSGSDVWGTELSGIYPYLNNVSWLTSPPVLVPITAAGYGPALRFRYWQENYGNCSATWSRVQLNDGGGFSSLPDGDGCSGGLANVGGWTEVVIDLSTWEGQSVELRFEHDVGNTFYADDGLYVDLVEMLAYQDTDGDGVSLCGDCDDLVATAYPGAPEICDGADSDCDGIVPAGETDSDGDGSPVCDGDCDDNDPLRAPGLPEVCDGIDNDCDGVVPAGELIDSDGDGAIDCVDCADSDASIYPGATELCEGLDTDCDGAVPADELDDDGDGIAVCDGDCDDGEAAVAPGLSEVCDGLDNDCDGALGAGEVDADGDGQLACLDCDDADSTVFAGAPELCDGLDNDCDGTVEDEEQDTDGDGVTPCAGDCDDDEPLSAPGLVEQCDGEDNDCDGAVPADEADQDADGFGICEGDCDDAAAEASPDGDESTASACADGLDNDCDGLIDASDDDCPAGDDDDSTGDDDDSTGDDDDSTGDDDDSTGDDDDSAGDDDDSAGDDDDSTSDDDDSIGDDDDDDAPGGCACTTGGSGPSPALLLLGLALAARRRRGPRTLYT